MLIFFLQPYFQKIKFVKKREAVDNAFHAFPVADIGNLASCSIEISGQTICEVGFCEASVVVASIIEVRSTSKAVAVTVRSRSRIAPSFIDTLPLDRRSYQIACDGNIHFVVGGTPRVSSQNEDGG
jgi:hypothetical protein